MCLSGFSGGMASAETPPACIRQRARAERPEKLVSVEVLPAAGSRWDMTTFSLLEGEQNCGSGF